MLIYSMSLFPDNMSQYTKHSAGIKVPANLMFDNLKYLDVKSIENIHFDSPYEISGAHDFFKRVLGPFNYSITTLQFLFMSGCYSIHIVVDKPFSFYK